MPATVNLLTPMAQVADVEVSIRFYELLGFEMVDTLEDESGNVCWADMVSGDAVIMFSLAEQPVVPQQQGILFYLRTDDLKGLREELIANGVSVPEIDFPDYMPAGEMRMEDPDGYSLVIGQSDEALIEEGSEEGSIEEASA